MLEPFITPALFQKYPTAIDEWTFSTSMAADGGLSQLEEHYKTFIVSTRASRFMIVEENPVTDRRRHCGDCGRWTELDPTSDSLLVY